MEKEAALTPEEEAVKRNTDCVYFLASPLTCKKGIECEYRHSEGARVNPRDCYYWLNGNCLNPKCLFRHPPLEGLFGTLGTTSVPALPPKQLSTHQKPVIHAHLPNNTNKPSVPCYFFPKGQCLKGDRCAFMHGSSGPQPAGTPAPQQALSVSASVTQPPQTFKKEWNLKECASQQKNPNSGVSKPAEFPASVPKPFIRSDNIASNGVTLQRSFSPYPQEVDLSRSQQANLPVSNGVALQRSFSPYPQEVDLSRSQQANLPVSNGVPASMTRTNQFLPSRSQQANLPINNGLSASMTRTNQFPPANERLQNGRKPDEFLGESSPGFDVLVEDDVEDSGYLHDEDEFGRELVQEGRSSYPATDLNHHYSDYESKLERDRLNTKDKYDRYEQKRSHGREQRRSPERTNDGRLLPEWRVRQREESPDEIDGLDLRHRLLKQRRVSRSRSAVSPDRHVEPRRRDDRYVEGDRYASRHRDQRNFPPERSISSRLQGRIKLPSRSSPDHSVGLRSEREHDRGRQGSRFSPIRPTSYLERDYDRVKRRSDEDLALDNKKFRSQIGDIDPLSFAGPKSLAELKNTNVSESSQERPNNGINSRFSAASGAVGVQDDGAISSDGKGNSYSDEEEGALGSFASETASELIPLSGSVNGGNPSVPNIEKSFTAVEEEEEGLIHESGEVDYSTSKDTAEVVDCLVVNTAGEEKEVVVTEAGEVGHCPEKGAADKEDIEANVSNQGTEEFEYEEGDMKAEDDEMMYDDDYLDDEGDDFATKDDIMYS